MSFSTTYSESTSFTLTHARHLGAKVATDLRRIQRLYGEPSDQRIQDFEAEVVALLNAGYLQTVTYGYKRNGEWIEPTLRYSARELANSNGADDDPGKVRPGANIQGGSFYSFLSYSSAWFALSDAGQASFEAGLPFARNTAAEPTISGYWDQDRSYSAGGRTLTRESVRSSR